MAKKNKAFNYDKAKEEIEAIMKELNDPELSIDELKSKVEKAVQLISQCKKALQGTKEEISEILDSE
jgi:exodeoxyribonuclease VII small subunit